MSKKKFQLIEVLKMGERVVSMITFRNQILIATTRNLYKLDDSGFSVVELVMEEEEEDASPEV